MFDGRWRDAVDRSTRPVGAALHRRGITADVLTATGLVSATGTAVAVATGHLHIAIILLILTGLHDLLDGPVAKIDASRLSPPRLVQAPFLDDYRPCPRTGVWERALLPGADVRAGDLIGRIHDFDDHPAQAHEVRAHRDGVLIASFLGARCTRGLTLFVIAEDTQI